MMVFQRVHCGKIRSTFVKICESNPLYGGTQAKIKRAVILAPMRPFHQSLILSSAAFHIASPGWVLKAS